MSNQPGSPNLVPEQGTHHRRKDFYSEESPIPSIQRFFKRGLTEVLHRNADEDDEEDDDQDDDDNDLDADPALSANTKETDIADQAKRSHQAPKEADKAYKRSRKPRLVMDPVTGDSIWTRDVSKKQYRRVMDQADRGQRSAATENVLAQAFPPEAELPTSIQQVHPLILPLFCTWALVTVLSLVPVPISVAANAWLAWWLWKTIHNGLEDHRWHRERVRGKAFRQGNTDSDSTRAGAHAQDDNYASASPIEGPTEGAEWLNAMMESLWAVMNPELFASLGGTLEDVMQASIPKFIHAVKVQDIAQGSTPIRLTGLRILPDHHVQDLCRAEKKETEDKYRREQRIPHSASDAEQAVTDDDSGTTNPQDQFSGSKYINLELGFVYRAQPTANTLMAKSRNGHLLIKFWIGARKLYSVPLPVWVEIKGLVGKVRVRVQLTPDPPFVKNVTFTFVGLPRVRVEVVPLHINTSNIPFLSGFIQSSIDAAVGEYVAPSSLTMDVGEILMGDNIKREVNAVGVLVVYIHRATDLEKRDLRGSSDPYCTLSFAKYGKILASTRVAINDLSPRWEERAVIVVTPDHIRSQEKISIALWDSDRFSSDDMLGRAEVDLNKLVNRPGRIFKRSDPLIGLNREMKTEGTIHWSLGFYTKAPNKRRLKDEQEAEKAPDETDWNEEGEKIVDGKRLSLDPSISDVPLLTEQLLPDEQNVQTRHQETAVEFEPPDPELPSGILSMQVHQIADLEVANTRHNLGRQKADEPGQEVEQVETDDDSPRAPSSYVTIILNDETIFRTRTKALNSNPFFNAGTERFIRDWRRTLLMFVVRDYRLREADTILGVVPIKLSDLFKDTSQVTQFFPIAGGLGHGRIRISLLFRPITNMSRAKNKLGWNIGTLRLLSSPVAGDFVGDATARDLHLTSLRAYTLAGRNKISAHRARYTRDETGIEWQLHDGEFPFKVPVRRRHATPYVIEFRSMNALGKPKVVAMCILWLQDMSDDDIVEQRLPIWRGADLHRLRQNYHDFRNEAEAEEFGVHKMGYLSVRMQFKSGVGKIHTKFEGNADARAVMEAWRCCVSAGLRSVTGDFAEGINSDDEDGNGNGNGNGNGSRSSLSEGEVEVEGEGEGDEEDGEHGDTASAQERSLGDKMRRWRDETREKHRQHRGIKQYKPVRTASWLGTSARSSGSKLFRKLSVQERRTMHVETEL